MNSRNKTLLLAPDIYVTILVLHNLIKEIKTNVIF